MRNKRSRARRYWHCAYWARESLSVCAGTHDKFGRNGYHCSNLYLQILVRNEKKRNSGVTATAAKQPPWSDFHAPKAFHEFHATCCDLSDMNRNLVSSPVLAPLCRRPLCD